MMKPKSKPSISTLPAPQYKQTNTAKNRTLSASEWEQSPEYKMAVMLKILRAMKNYGYNEWMSVELKKIGYSL